MMRMLLMMLLAIFWGVAHAEQAAPATAPDISAEEDQEAPDAMAHMRKAPPFNINRISDPFESYLTKPPPSEEVDFKRKREPLEFYDLSTLRLVAIFQMGEERVAMVEDSSGQGHRVRRGNYMGKHQGRIEKIEAKRVLLVEKVRSPAGPYVERQVELKLQ